LHSHLCVPTSRFQPIWRAPLSPLRLPASKYHKTPLSFLLTSQNTQFPTIVIVFISCSAFQVLSHPPPRLSFPYFPSPRPKTPEAKRKLHHAHPNPSLKPSRLLCRTRLHPSAHEPRSPPLNLGTSTPPTSYPPGGNPPYSLPNETLFYAAEGSSVDTDTERARPSLPHFFLLRHCPGIPNSLCKLPSRNLQYQCPGSAGRDRVSTFIKESLGMFRG
ncbi:uncharacterized protein BDZ99DRAFT_545360, partial [Mytilinidion resinicola]